eukprot:8723157-Karenia_brevis.AAC.2
MHEISVATFNLQKLASASCEDLRDAMLHELGHTPILLLQEVPTWTGEADFPGYEIHSQLGFDTAIGVPMELATQIRDIVKHEQYTRVLVNDFAFGSLHVPDSSQ